MGILRDVWDIGEKTNHLYKERQGKRNVEKVLSAMTPHHNVRRSDVAKLLKMSEAEVLQALRVLREEDKVISLDVDEEPKEKFWTRI